MTIIGERVGSLLGSFVLQLLLKSIDLLLQLSFLPFQIFVICFQLFNVCVRWSSKRLLDELECVSWLLSFFVEADEDLRQLVDHAGFFQVLSKIFLLLFGCLDAHFKF